MTADDARSPRAVSRLVGTQALLIPGAWATPYCWRYFAPLLVERGFQTLAPPWPFKDRPIADQLLHADPRLAKTGIREVVDHYKAIIRRQAEPPLLIGHSFGGLIVQILLDQGYGAAGIAISSVPPRGVSPIRIFSSHSLKMVRSLFRQSFSWRKVLAPPQPCACSVETNLVPESGRIFRQLYTSAARVDFRNNRRAPLLLIGCGKDVDIPAETCRRNHAMYEGSTARTDFVQFPNLTHFSIGESGCGELASYCAEWAERAVPAVRAMPQPARAPELAACLYSH